MMTTINVESDIYRWRFCVLKSQVMYKFCFIFHGNMCFISITTRPDVENKLRCLTAEEDCEINREEGNITWSSKGETFCSCSHSYCEFLFHFASFVWFCSQKHKREAADRWTDAVWQKQWGNIVALTSSFHSCRRKNRTVNIERNCSLLLISCSVLQMHLIHRQMYQRQWEWTHMPRPGYLPSEKPRID